MNLEEQLKQIILERYKSMREFANSIDIPYSTVDTILKRGIMKANVVNIIAICNKLNIDVDSLSLGKIKEKPAHISVSISKNHDALLKKYHALDEHGKDIVDTVLIKEYDRIQLQRQIKEQNKNKLKFIERQCSAYSTSAGVGLKIFDDIETFSVKLEANNMTIMSDLILHISGGSMEPKFYNDEYIAIKYHPTISVGEIGIFIVNGDSYIKKLGTDRLISLNKNYDDIIFNENDSIFCVGKVLGKVEIYE